MIDNKFYKKLLLKYDRHTYSGKFKIMIVYNSEYDRHKDFQDYLCDWDIIKFKRENECICSKFGKCSYIRNEVNGKILPICDECCIKYDLVV